MRASRGAARACVVIAVAATLVVAAPSVTTSAGPPTAPDTAGAGSLAAFGATMTVLSLPRLLPAEPSAQLAGRPPQVRARAVADRRADVPEPPRRADSSSAMTTRPAAGPAGAADAPGVRTIGSYVVAPQSQADVDACRLVLWWRSPDLLAGHDWCGFAWFASLRVGERVDVLRGPVAGAYVVVARQQLARQSGDLPSFDADLVLQTCVGDRTSFALLRRI